MGHKIFISYKYKDNDVKRITSDNNENTVRDYVNKLEQLFETTDYIYKGESDGEDLSHLSDDAIWETLKNRIYDSTLTIVMISKKMKENTKDRNQWIPWEISYSLKEISRKNKAGNMVTSSSNAILAIVIPDKEGSYSYFLEDNVCCNTKCRTVKSDKFFKILERNMFNIKNPTKTGCPNGKTLYQGTCSYIVTVKWEDFISNYNKYIDTAYYNQNSIEKFDVYKEVD